MRPIKFKKWIPGLWVTEKGGKILKKGTFQFEDNFNQEGLFHEWGNDFQEFENGAGNFTIAIVELDDGNIEKVLPENIQFDDKLKWD